LNSRLHCTYLLGSSPMLRWLHVLGQRGGKNFVWQGRY
jgi:hypothetical protein